MLYNMRVDNERSM